MPRTKLRTYQGREITFTTDNLIRADLAVSEDRRGTFSPTPQQQARAAIEAARAIAACPSDAAVIRRALAFFYKVEPAPLEPEF